MSADDGALWSRQEIATQAAQCRDQLTVWDILAVTRDCEACGAASGEPCAHDCIGAADYAESGGML